jgi:mRNA interferase RelE/StbE
MAWTVEFDKRALKGLDRLSTANKLRISRFIDERVLKADDPRKLGTALTGGLGGLWRYRVGDLRIVAKIIDHRLVVLVVEIGHRREVYRQ